MKKLAFITVVCLFLAVLAYSLLPCTTGEEQSVFSVPMGTGLSRIARDLEDGGYVRSGNLFKLAATLTGSKHRLKAGEYEIPPGSNLWQVLKLLKSGKSLLHEFVVPEGYSSVQIAELLGRQKLADPAKFEALVNSSAQAQRLGIHAHGLEGYLFPDTYQIPRGLGEERIIRMMVDRFREKVGAGLLEQGREYGLKPEEVVTLASVVEREARRDSERPKVASVFLNRLHINMRLESCATVRFAMNKYTGPVLSQDLHFRSPYNTYRHRGMPPGPICSPGIVSLQAAAQPAKTRYLFFVVAGDGAHVFSETFEEHLKAKFRHRRQARAENVIED